jgi:hypothetical protein
MIVSTIFLFTMHSKYPYHYYSLWEEAYSSQVIEAKGKPSQEVVIGVRKNMESQVTFNLHQKLNSDLNTSF